MAYNLERRRGPRAVVRVNRGDTCPTKLNAILVANEIADAL